MSIQFKDGYAERVKDGHEGSELLAITVDGRTVAATLADWFKAFELKQALDRNAEFNKAASEALQKSVDSRKVQGSNT